MAIKSEDDLTFDDIYLFLRLNFRFMLSIFILFLLIFSLIFTIWPKYYVSESSIRLASIGSDINTKNLFTPVEAKSIIESGKVLESAVEKYNFLLESNRSIRKFKEENLEVEVYKERIGRDEFTGNALIIRVITKSPEVSMSVNREILDSFLVYANPFYEKRLRVYASDLEETNFLISDIEKEANIAKELLNKFEHSNNLQSSSDEVLLTQVQVSYRSHLISLFDRRMRIEKDIANGQDFKILSNPEYPRKFSIPSFKLFSFISLVLSLFFAIIAGFLKSQKNSFKH
jgi:uncharacterized protein involved in exopolysaccharide biosynthesis